MKFLVHFMLIMGVLFVSACSKSEKEPKTIIVNASDIVEKKIKVDGMTCVGCEVTLEKAMSKVNGVVKVKASSSNDEVTLSYDKTKTDEKTVSQMIENFGYKPFNAVKK